MTELFRRPLIEYIKTIRQKRKVSMREISAITGSSIPFISEMENLKKDIGLERFLKHIDALGLTFIIAPKRKDVVELKEACDKLIKLL